MTAPPGAASLAYGTAAAVTRLTCHPVTVCNEVPVRAGSFIRFDPTTVRCPVAGPDGMTFVAVGSRLGSYEPHGPF